MHFMLSSLFVGLLSVTQTYGFPTIQERQASSIPRPTRYITANDDNGNSYFYADIDTTVAISHEYGNSGSSESLAYTNDRAPAEISETTDIDEYKTVLQNPPESLYRDDGGANVWFIDVPPMGTSPFHRTISVDYDVIVHGALTLETSDGDSRDLGVGDMVINRANLHRWTNKSPTDYARIMAVITTVQPVVTKNNGTLQTTL